MDEPNASAYTPGDGHKASAPKRCLGLSIFKIIIIGILRSIASRRLFSFKMRTYWLFVSVGRNIPLTRDRHPGSRQLNKVVLSVCYQLMVVHGPVDVPIKSFKMVATFMLVAMFGVSEALTHVVETMFRNSESDGNAYKLKIPLLDCSDVAENFTCDRTEILQVMI
jgi:hypothetical protein